MRASLAAATVAALAACATDPTAPQATAQAFEHVAALTVIGTPPTTNRDLEGQAWVCKAGTPSTQTFSFTYTAKFRNTNAVLATGTVSLTPGQCTMVASVNREVRIAGGLLLDVSEATLPANWSLTTIASHLGVVSTFTPPIQPTISLATQSIVNQFWTHDIGTVVTFTNTYTPPPPPPSCTRTQGYWKTHQELWDASGERVVWNGETFFNSGKTYAEIFAMSAAGGNSYIQLAHQYMAAKLNVNNGSDPTIDAAIAQAEALLGGHAAGSAYIKNATWTALAGTLDNYNNGVTGPGHCAG